MKAAVIGRAWRTPLGTEIDPVIERLLAGDRAAAPNLRFDAGTYRCSLAAPIQQAPAPSRHARFLRRMGLHAVDVAAEAMANAGVTGSDRVGLFFGYGGLRAHWDDLIAAFEHQDASGEGAWDRGLVQLHPFWMLQHLSNNAHAIAAQELGARGEGATYGGANAGAQALAAAIRALAAGSIDVAIVAGHDTLIEPETLVELGERSAVTEATLDTLAAPYDTQARGFVPAEAAAAVVLARPGSDWEALSHVQAGEGADGSAHEGRIELIARLINRFAEPGDAIDGAGIASANWDHAERIAAAAMVGDAAPLCCIMSAMGHIGAASSIVQTIALTELLRRQVLAPIAGLRSPASGPLRPLLQVCEVRSRSAIGLSSGAPGLAGIVRVELP